MRRTKIRHRAATTVTLAGVLALGACGGAGGEGKRADDRPARDGATEVTADEATGENGVVIDDTFAAAAASTMHAGSARVRMTMTLPVPGMGENTVTIEGLADFSTGDGQMTMDMGALMGDAVAALGGDLTVEIRVVDGVMYMHYPETMAQFMGGTPWLSIDAGDALGGDSQGLAGPFGQSDPTRYLEYLAAVSSGVEEIGREPVGGVDTTRYHAVIDFSKAIEQVPDENLDALGLDADAFAVQLSEMQGLLGSEMPVDVWIDDDGLLRRMSMDMSVAGQAAHLQMEIWDYGVDVNVEAPPADQVGDMGSMLGDLGEGFGFEDASA
jgi:hypothetical protein